MRKISNSVKNNNIPTQTCSIGCIYSHLNTMLLKLFLICVCVNIAVGQGAIPGVKNTCFLDPEPGQCKAYLPSFYYNKAAKYCDCFVYTGCNGNENRFDTLDECRYACNVESHQQVITNTCRSILRGTPLLAQLLNRTEFQGISTKDSTTEVSKGQSPSGADPDCFQVPEMGPCKAYLPSYFYDVKNNYCDCFVYSGCGGNENRFRTLNDCRQLCDVGPKVQVVTNSCRNILKGTYQWDEFLLHLSVVPGQNPNSDKKNTSKLDHSKDSSFPISNSGDDKNQPSQSSQANRPSSGSDLPSHPDINRNPPRNPSLDGSLNTSPQFISVAPLPARPIPFHPPHPSSPLRDVVESGRAPSVITYLYQKVRERGD